MAWHDRIRSFRKKHRDRTLTHPSDSAERRSKFRYPLDLGVRFRLLSNERLLVGLGRTVNVSAGGLLVVSKDLESRDEVRPGARMELSIEWPVLLDGRIGLQLIGIGAIVRRGEFDFAAKFERHEFRTVKSSGLHRWDGTFAPAPLILSGKAQGPTIQLGLGNALREP